MSWFNVSNAGPLPRLKNNRVPSPMSWNVQNKQLVYYKTCSNSFFILFLERLRLQGTGKRGHIVADTLLLMMSSSWARKRAGHKMNVVFPCCANWETDTKCFWTKSKTFFVSATNVARVGKRGNICVGNNVSSFASTLRKPRRQRQCH